MIRFISKTAAVFLHLIMTCFWLFFFVGLQAVEPCQSPWNGLTCNPSGSLLVLGFSNGLMNETYKPSTQIMMTRQHELSWSILSSGCLCKASLDISLLARSFETLRLVKFGQVSSLFVANPYIPSVETPSVACWNHQFLPQRRWCSSFQVNPRTKSKMVVWIFLTILLLLWCLV